MGKYWQFICDAAYDFVHVKPTRDKPLPQRTLREWWAVHRAEWQAIRCSGPDCG